MKAVSLVIISILIYIIPLCSQTVFTVTNSNDNGIGSLRQSILDANNSVGKDTIKFSISGIGPFIIQPVTALPAITEFVVIDGFSQSGANPNTNPIDMPCNATYMIQLDGSLAPLGTNGLNLMSNSCTIRGLVIGNFNGSGVNLTNSDSCKIQGNYIGIDQTGIQANSNSDEGIEIINSSNNIIGGRNPEDRNIISGNVSDGIDIEGSISSNNIIQGNFVGIDRTGTIAVGNVDDGIEIESPMTIIGDTLTEGRNIISGNGDRGIQIQDSLAINNKIIGNLIGTDITGTAVVGNIGKGIQIRYAKNNIVGGTTADESNVISGNYDGIEILDPSSTGNIIQGNLIGTDINGTVVLGNTEEGIEFDNAAQCIIGGDIIGAGNVIAGSGAYGITIKHPGATGNIVKGNFIGIDRNASVELPNYGYGIYIDDFASGNEIGGNSGNIIAYNLDNGICLSNSAGSDNLISTNLIFANSGLGIDLNEDSVTVNDLGDGDTGPNNLQNYPVLDSAIIRNENLEIYGRLNSNPNITFHIEFFTNMKCDTSNYGEGQFYLDTTSVTTDANGNRSFVVSTSSTGLVGQFISSTATDSSNNTSEFSQCIEIQNLSKLSSNNPEYPKTFKLYQNYPNPFNPTTTIEFSIPKTEQVTLRIYNLLGQEVTTLVSEKLTPGEYIYTWNASQLASGIYLYKLQTESYSSTKKLILLR
jgi:hypothetical protein